MDSAVRDMYLIDMTNDESAAVRRRFTVRER